MESMLKIFYNKVNKRASKNHYRVYMKGIQKRRKMKSKAIKLIRPIHLKALNLFKIITFPITETYRTGFSKEIILIQ